MSKFHMTGAFGLILLIGLLSPCLLTAHEPDDGDPTPWSLFSACGYGGWTADGGGNVNACIQFSFGTKAAAGGGTSSTEDSLSAGSRRAPCDPNQEIHCVWHNAIELDAGLAEIDVGQPPQETDVTYLTAGYRRYFYQRKSRYRFAVGMGVGVYDAGITEWGYHLKSALGISLTNLHNVWLELGSTYHRLESDLDFVNLFVGFRFHTPARNPQ